MSGKGRNVRPPRPVVHLRVDRTPGRPVLRVDGRAVDVARGADPARAGLDVAVRRARQLGRPVRVELADPWSARSLVAHPDGSVGPARPEPVRRRRPAGVVAIACALAAFLVVGGVAVTPVGSRILLGAAEDCRAVTVFAAGGTTPGSGEVLRAVTDPVAADPARVAVVAVPPPGGQGSYSARESAAVTAMAGSVSEHATSCPASRLILLGHSEGAQVAGDLAARIGAGRVPAVPAERVLAVGLFGDPARDPATRTVPEGVAGQGALPPRPSGFGALDARTIEVCAPGDPVCAGPAEPGFPALDRAFAAPAHASYAQVPVADGLTATRWASDSLRTVVAAVPAATTGTAATPPVADPTAADPTAADPPVAGTTAAAGTTEQGTTEQGTTEQGTTSEQPTLLPIPGTTGSTTGSTTSSTTGSTTGSTTAGSPQTTPAPGATTTRSPSILELPGANGAEGSEVTIPPAPATTTTPRTTTSPTASATTAPRTTTPGPATSSSPPASGSGGGAGGGSAGTVTGATWAMTGGLQRFKSTPWNNEGATDPAAAASPNVPGRQAVRFQMPSGGKRTEAEPDVENFQDGETKFVGYSGMFAQGFPVDTDDWQLIMQFKQPGTGSPPLAVEVGKGQLRLANNGTGQKDFCPVAAGQAFSFTLGITFGGTIDAWCNGRQTLTEYQTPSSNVSGSAYLKTGIYRNTAITGASTLFLNDLKIGDSLASVSGLAGAPGTSTSTSTGGAAAAPGTTSAAPGTTASTTGTTSSTTSAAPSSTSDAPATTTGAAEGDDGADQTGGGGGGEKVCEKFGSTRIAGGAYMVQNNEWGASDGQCITATQQGFTVDSGDHHKDDSPAAYPSIMSGCWMGTCTTGTTLPRQISALGPISSSIAGRLPAGTKSNLAYDIWADPTPKKNGQNSGMELMIWLKENGGIKPIGSKSGTVTIGGATWDVWKGTNGGVNVISYVRQGYVETADNLPITDFVKDSVKQGSAQDGWYLTNIQAGFEPWTGGPGLALTKFSVSTGGAPAATG